MAEFKMCDCGRPLHYSTESARAGVDAIVAEMGPTVIVRTLQGAWHVPRHYIALHGIQAPEVPALAALYEWPIATDEERAAAS